MELEISPLGASVSDKKYDRPANPMISVILEASNGMVVSCEMNKPKDDPIIILVNSLIDFIFKFGKPREVRVSNVIVEAALEQICEICGIKLKRVKRLKAVDEFLKSMRRFR